MFSSMISQKNRNIGNYDLNLVKLDSILKNGILSKDLIEQKQLPSIYTHSANNFNSKNGYSYVTSFTVKTELNELYFSFSLHTLTSVSLI